MTYFEHDQINRYANEGCLVDKGFYSVTEIASIKRELLDMAKQFPAICSYENSMLSGQEILHRIYCPLHLNTQIASIIKLEQLTALVKSLWGEDVLLLTDKVNVKYPGGRGFGPHADMDGLFKDYVDNIISVFICLDDCTISNGCLEVYSKESDTFLPVLANSGDLIFLDGHLCHRSAANHSPNPRICYILTFNRFSMADHRPKFITGDVNTVYKG